MMDVNNQNMVHLYQQKMVGFVHVVNINKNIDENLVTVFEDTLEFSRTYQCQFLVNTHLKI
jgi:hypothetical protein